MEQNQSRKVIYNYYQNLEITNDSYAAVVNPPENYFDLLGGTIQAQKKLQSLNSGRFDIIHLFVNESSNIKEELMNALFSLTPWGIIWLSFKTNDKKSFVIKMNKQILMAVNNLGLKNEKQILINEIYVTHKIISA